MKTNGITHLKLRTVIGLTFILAVSSYSRAFGQQQQGETDKYLEALPADLILKEKEPQRYMMTAVYLNKDIYSNFINKTLVSGEYTRGLDDGYVKWNNVKISESNSLTGMFPEGLKQDYMEDFRYKPSEDIVKESVFEKFPVNNLYSMQTKNLIWDMVGFEIFAWLYFDSLELNQNYAPADLSGEVPLAGMGYFENNNLQLNWTGISKINGEVCAIIQFLAMDNPFEINTELNGIKFAIKGRSHYWGNVWVSLEDKQIEHAVLYEDAVMNMDFSESQNQLVNTTREITLRKIM